MRLYGLLKYKFVAGKGQATKLKWLNVVTLNICCFNTFKNIREC